MTDWETMVHEASKTANVANATCRHEGTYTHLISANPYEKKTVKMRLKSSLFNFSFLLKVIKHEFKVVFMSNTKL